MNNQTAIETESPLTILQGEIKTTVNHINAENPIILRALRRLKESQINDNHVSHYTKHSSYSTKHSSNW